MSIAAGIRATKRMTSVRSRRCALLSRSTQQHQTRWPTPYSERPNSHSKEPSPSRYTPTREHPSRRTHAHEQALQQLFPIRRTSSSASSHGLAEKPQAHLSCVRCWEMSEQGRRPHPSCLPESYWSCATLVRTCHCPSSSTFVISP